MSEQFCRSNDSKKVHIRGGASGRPSCGAGGWYGNSFKEVVLGDVHYPKSISDLCKTCRTASKYNKFLVEMRLKDKPDAVTSCVHVDIHVPTKKLVPIREAEETFTVILEEIHRYAELDASGVCVRFSLKEY